MLDINFASPAPLAPSSALALVLLFTTLAGSMLQPLLVGMARLAWRFKRTLIRIVIAHGLGLARAEIFGRLLLALAVLIALLATGARPTEAQSQTLAVATTSREAPASAATIDQTLDTLMRAIRMARKPLPAWALDAAEKAYKMFQTYRNGQKVEEMRRNVEATLRLVDSLRADLEGGLALDDGRYRLVREALDAHDSALDALAGRVDDLERWARERLETQGRHLAEVAKLTESNRQLALANDQKAREIERIVQQANERVRQAEEQLRRVVPIVTRPGCGTGRYWDREAQECVAK